MARIVVGGWHHETNTFAPSKADYKAFAQGGGWPALARGPAMFEAVHGINLPVTGFIDAAREERHELAPLLWCSASPSAEVTTDAYERIAGMLLEDLRASLPADALYLDLHGAMVTEHLEDGEGEMLRRARSLAGPKLTIVVTLDFHANVTQAMVDNADALIAYRTYPHVDMAETGRRAAHYLGRALKDHARRVKAFRRIPFLVPLTWQCTLIEPARSLYERARALESGQVDSVSLPMGFPLADILDCGPTVLAYGRGRKAVEHAADDLERVMLEREGDFAGKLWEPDDSVRHAMAAARRVGGPVILVDTQDNPGAGANGDTTGLLQSLVRAKAERAVVAMIHDPEVASIAHRAGVGAKITVGLGEKSGLPGHAPFRATFRVERLGDGSFTATGPFYSGSRMRLGPMALLALGGTRVVVASKKQQCADQAMLRHVGVEPREQAILALKSSVHFRADFQDMAGEILIVTAPGPSVADPTKLPFRRLRDGMRLGPLGPVFRRT
ncbi:MAG: M81 family metallopeptidase [Alphaproteobacteria bacterium]